MLKRTAFTLLELIFVIVIMGIIGKFGIEFLAQAYKSFIFSKVNHELQSKSGAAVELIAAKLRHRIKDSVIARTGTFTSPGTPVAIANADDDVASYTILEWVGVDYDGFRGYSSSSTKPSWSGIIDLDNIASSSSTLVSPQTNTTTINTIITNLSNAKSSINDAGLFFIGANSDIQTGYGWDGNLSAINNQDGSIHPIKADDTLINAFNNALGTSDFTAKDIYEYYLLVWSAYAIIYEPYNNGTHMGDLKLYWNYQPWKGERFNTNNIDVQSVIITKNVSTFQFTAIGDIIKIQVCTKSTIISGTDDKQGYSLCKEKTIL